MNDTKNNNTYPFVSVIMACRNEADFIRKSLGSLLKTDYPKDRLEIIVIDGESDDGTGEILHKIGNENPMIKIMINHKIVKPVAVNMGLRASRGDIIVIVDAHAEYSADYISKCVEYLNKTDAWLVGGPVHTLPSKNTLTARIIAGILSSPFGVGSFTSHRVSRKSGYTTFVPFGAFRREILEKAGYYNERLEKNQDNEFCKKILRHGGRIFITPDIKNIYYARPTLGAFLSNAMAYGKCNAVTQIFYPGVLALRHFVPFIFFIGCMGCLLMIAFGLTTGHAWAFVAGAILLLTYAVLAFFASIKLCMDNSINLSAAPYTMLVYFLFHFTYGYGTAKQLIKMMIRRPLEYDKK